jgi:hypothetical protein
VGARAAHSSPWMSRHDGESNRVQHAACERLAARPAVCCSSDASRESAAASATRGMAGCARGRVPTICCRRCSWVRVVCVLPEIGGRRSDALAAPAEEPSCAAILHGRFISRARSTTAHLPRQQEWRRTTLCASLLGTRPNPSLPLCNASCCLRQALLL